MKRTILTLTLAAMMTLVSSSAGAVLQPPSSVPLSGSSSQLQDCVGGWVVYQRMVETGSHIFARCPVRPLEEVPLVVHAGRNERPVLSPSGDELAFAHRSVSGAGPWQIYLLTISTGEIRRISTYAGNNGEVPSDWSADGRYLLYDSTQGNTYFDWDVWRLDFETGERRRLTATGASSLSSGGARWSADDTHVYYNVEQYSNHLDLWRVGADGTGATRVTRAADAGDSATNPRPAASGEHVVFFLQEQGNATVWVTNGTGHARSLGVSAPWGDGCCPPGLEIDRTCGRLLVPWPAQDLRLVVPHLAVALPFAQGLGPYWQRSPAAATDVSCDLTLAVASA